MGGTDLNEGVILKNAKRIPVNSVSEVDFIQAGEVLFNNTNSTTWVGKTAVLYEKTLPSICCSNHVTRIVPNVRISSEYLSAVFNMMQRLGYFSKLSTNFNNQAGINSETLEKIVILLPSLAIQNRLVSELDVARVERDEARAKADSLLSGIDHWLTKQLGIKTPKNRVANAYAIHLKAREPTKQLGADYYHPERVDALRAIQAADKADKVVGLGEIVAFKRDTEKEADPDKYIGLANIESNTGELAVTTEEPGKGQCFFSIKAMSCMGGSALI